MEKIWEVVEAELDRRFKGAKWKPWLRNELNITDQTIYNWSVRDIPAKDRQRVAQLLGWTVEYMTEMQHLERVGVAKSQQPYVSPLEYAGRPKTSHRVPVVGTAKLGGDGFYYELEHPVGHGDGSVDVYSADRNAYAVRVKGDSMYPAIRHGEVVVVEPSGQLVPSERVLLALKDGRKMVKELVAGRDDSVTVTSVNGGERMTFGREEIEYIHAVTMVVSASKWRPSDV